MALDTVFEKEVCGRCGGGGRYSFNLTHGSTCFGCGGKGERLTKRGAAARQFYIESCSVSLTDVKVGDIIAMGGVTLGGTPYSQKRAVHEVVTKPDVNGHVAVYHVNQRGERHGYHGTAATRVRKYWSKEENDAKIAAALAYQATLTKTGKPSKR